MQQLFGRANASQEERAPTREIKRNELVNVLRGKEGSNEPKLKVAEAYPTSANSLFQADLSSD